MKRPPERPSLVRVLTLGCKVNQHESACLLERLLGTDFREARINESPDLCLINTCAVTSRAEAESRRLIRRARSQGARVVALGCAVEADPSLAEVCDLAVGNAGKPGLAAQLLGDAAGEPLVASRFGGRARATIKLQDGCNGCCSYCIVPRLRGRSRSLPREQALSELERLAALGFPEVVLCAVHLGAWGADLSPPATLGALLKSIAGLVVDLVKARSLPLRVRLSTLEPQEAQEILPLLGSGIICRHLHISLQSGSDAVLSRMRRRYLAQDFRDLVLAAAAAVPGLAIGCDVIAGFPGETEAEFAETLDLLEALPVSYLHVFPFSPRPGTAASIMAGQVSAAEKSRRAAALRLLSARKRKTFYQAQVGSTVQLVLQGRDRATGLPRGLSDNYVPVLVDSAARRLSGRVLGVRIDRLIDSRLVASPL